MYKFEPKKKYIEELADTGEPDARSVSDDSEIEAEVSDEQDFNENYNPTNVDESFLERIEDTRLNSLTNRLNNSGLNATELFYHTIEII